MTTQCILASLLPTPGVHLDLRPTAGQLLRAAGRPRRRGGEHRHRPLPGKLHLRPLLSAERLHSLQQRPPPDQGHGGQPQPPPQRLLHLLHGRGRDEGASPGQAQEYLVGGQEQGRGVADSAGISSAGARPAATPARRWGSTRRSVRRRTAGDRWAQGGCHGRGDNRAATELSFGHVTTKTWANSVVFGFFRKNFITKYVPSAQIIFWKIQWEIVFLEHQFLGKNAQNFLE